MYIWLFRLWQRKERAAVIQKIFLLFVFVNFPSAHLSPSTLHCLGKQFTEKIRNGYFQQMIITMCYAQEVIRPSPMVPVILIANTFYHNVPAPTNKKRSHYLIPHNDVPTTSHPTSSWSLLRISEVLGMSGVCRKYLLFNIPKQRKLTNKNYIWKTESDGWNGALSFLSNFNMKLNWGLQH